MKESCSVILSISSMHESVDSADFVRRLKSMYLRWAERRGYNAAVLDERLLEFKLENGKKVSSGLLINECILRINGENAFATLKNECGVHRFQEMSKNFELYHDATAFMMSNRWSTSSLVRVYSNDSLHDDMSTLSKNQNSENDLSSHQRDDFHVRSYVIGYFNLVKDFQTGRSSNDPEAVFDGDFDWNAVA